MEKTVEIKSCKNCGVQFEITDKDLEFYDKVSPVFGGRKYGIPSPTHCPDCRQQRRLAWRNRSKMYKRTCDATGKPIISQFSPNSKVKVYHAKVWESDKFDAFQYGRDFDFSKVFFEQFKDLLFAVPMPHLALIENTLENSEYVNGATFAKNSYLSSNIVNVDSVLYSQGVYDSSYCVDCYSCTNCQHCYECIKCDLLNNCAYLNNCNNCSNLFYCNSCVSCNNCYGCVNLVNKSYCILNEQYSKEDYQQIVQHLGSDFLDKFYSLLLNSPLKFSKVVSSENVTGDNILNSRNVKDSIDIVNCESVSYSQFITANSKDVYDISYWGNNIAGCYEGQAIGVNASNIIFSNEVYDNVHKVYYSNLCYPNVSDCFACVGVRNAQYCVFNKQYTKEEYEELVPKIIDHMQKSGEWGEFLPISLSPFGYNETEAMDDFPLIKEQALKSGYNWLDIEYHVNIPDGIEKVDARNLPSSIKEVDDSILNKAILCEVTGKPYRIVRAELEFYRKHNIALPKRCPDQRHLDRLAKRNPRKLWKRTCDCSNCASNNNSNGPAVFKTTYSPDRPEKVYCEVCYNKEVYG